MGILIHNQFRLEAGRQLALSSRVSSERVGSRGRFRPSAIQFIHPQIRKHPVASQASHRGFPRSGIAISHRFSIVNNNNKQN
jgi:hypothetical protein